MICEQLHIISFELLIISAAGTAPGCYNDVFSLYCLLFINSEDLPDPPAECVSYDTVPDSLADRNTQSVESIVIIFHIHDKNTAGFCTSGVVNRSVLTVLLDRRKPLHCSKFNIARQSEDVSFRPGNISLKIDRGIRGPYKH